MSSPISLKPSEATAGGLVSDITAEVVESKFASWDYNGTQPEPVPAMKWGMKDVDSGEEHEQYWSVGAAKDWVPSADGKSLIPTGSQTSLKKGSNGVMVLESIVNSGFPEDKIGTDISVFQGMVCHMVRIPAPVRGGLAKKPRADGKDYEATVLVVDRIDKFPWEAKKPAGAPGKPVTGQKPAGGQAAGKPAAGGTAAPADEDVVALATETIIGVVMEAGAPVPKANLLTAVYKRLAGNALQQKVVACVGKPGFVESIEMLAVADGLVQVAG